MLYVHNQVQLTGRVAADPELFLMTDGTAKCLLNLLQDHASSGRERPVNRFILIGWEGIARQLQDLVRKDDRLFVQGKLRTRSFVANGVNQFRTEVHLDQFVLLKSPRSSHRLLQSRNRVTVPVEKP